MNTAADKCIDMGILGAGGSQKGKLSDVEHRVTVSAFARRRLPVVLTRLRMADTVQAAVALIGERRREYFTIPQADYISNRARSCTRGDRDRYRSGFRMFTHPNLNGKDS